MEKPKLILYGVLAITVSWVAKALYDRPNVSQIPAVGSTSLLWSYVDAFRFLSRATTMVQQGYDQYNAAVFRVPILARWDLVVGGAKLTAEMGSAPETELSSMEAVHETLQTDYTMGKDMRINTYHLPAIRSSLTKNLAARFPDIHDEIGCAFDDIFALQGTEWKLVPVLSSMIDIVARTTNRLYIGLPYCRNMEYLKFSVQNTVDIMVGAQIIGMLPTALRPLFAPLISRRKRNLKTAVGYLGPLVEERLAMEEKHGADWEGKPNDLISWLLEAASAEQRTIPSLVTRILSLNMAAIHTTSLTFTHALYDLAAYPEYIPAMREEAARAVRDFGWSTAALANMHKIDSFLRESQRLNGIHIVNMMRKVVKPGGYTMSDGTVLPPGAFVSVAARAAHHDPEFYGSPYVFDGFRFAKMREGDGAGEGFKHHFVTTGVDYLAFGLGKHACPGRFFAAVESKAMLAHVVLNYDVKLEAEGVRPPDAEFAGMRLPNMEGRVCVRRREI
ncbi:cytochrome P450 [Mycena epipterygia]|nr:cytochrome P450 [Mycena epipterygia]